MNTSAEFYINHRYETNDAIDILRTSRDEIIDDIAFEHTRTKRSWNKICTYFEAVCCLRNAIRHLQGIKGYEYISSNF